MISGGKKTQIELNALVFLRHGVDKGFSEGKAIGYNAPFMPTAM